MHYKPASIVLEADRDRIAQVIRNLLHNAIKFTEKGTISVEAKGDGKAVTASKYTSGMAWEKLPYCCLKWAKLHSMS